MDFPELKFNEHESTEMPFRYVKTEDGKPIMPKVQGSPTCVVDGLNADRASQGMVELIQKDADKAVNDLF